MTFEEFKTLDYPDNLPMEFVLGDLFFKGKIDFLMAMRAYVNALEKERHIQHCRFCEASISLTQILGKNFKGKHKEKALKRAVHTFNLTTNLPRNIHDEQYGYTEADKKFWDERCKELYGVELDLENR